MLSANLSKSSSSASSQLFIASKRIGAGVSRNACAKSVDSFVNVSRVHFRTFRVPASIDSTRVTRGKNDAGYVSYARPNLRSLHICKGVIRQRIRRAAAYDACKRPEFPVLIANCIYEPPSMRSARHWRDEEASNRRTLEGNATALSERSRV